MRSALVLFVAIGLTTCVGPTSERAHRDEAVGRAAIEAASVEVVDGLASVRRLEPGNLSLWAQAPSVRVHAKMGTAADWTIELANAMSDATLEVVTELGDTPVVQSLETTRPTLKRWSVTVPANVDVTLSMHSARGEPTGPWRFAVLSDVQEAIDRVGDIYARMNEDPSIEFVASCGDLTQQGTPEQLDRFQRELERLRVPFFSTMGNHELGYDDGEPFQRQFGRGTFRFAYGGAQLTFVDSASATIDPLVYDWLTTWLEQGRALSHVVLMHIPPIDPIGVRNGSFADRNEAAKLLAKLAEGGADLSLYGHIHSYYAFANAGIPAYISGGGGAIPERFDGIGRHYLTIDVDPAKGVLEAGLVRIEGD